MAILGTYYGHIRDILGAKHTHDNAQLRLENEVLAHLLEKRPATGGKETCYRSKRDKKETKRDISCKRDKDETKGTN